MKSKLILGTVQLGLNYGINNQSGKPSIEKSFDILHTAFNNGITVLDTAESYGNSQEIIGVFHKKNPNKKFQIITKLSANVDINVKELVIHIANNCKILNTDRLYGYMFHNYNSFKNKVSFYDKILLAKKEGLIAKAGISLYDNSEVEDIITNYSKFDFIQIPFNLFDNASKRKQLLEKAKNKGIEIHSRSVFLQGLFFKENEKIPEDLKPLIKYLKILENIKNNNSVNTDELALQYVLQKKYIDYVLIGVESVEQLLRNIHVCNLNRNVPHNAIDAIQVKEEKLLNPSNWD